MNSKITSSTSAYNTVCYSALQVLANENTAHVTNTCLNWFDAQICCTFSRFVSHISEKKWLFLLDYRNKSIFTKSHTERQIYQEFLWLSKLKIIKNAYYCIMFCPWHVQNQWIFSDKKLRTQGSTSRPDFEHIPLEAFPVTCSLPQWIHPRWNVFLSEIMKHGRIKVSCFFFSSSILLLWLPGSSRYLQYVSCFSRVFSCLPMNSVKHVLSSPAVAQTTLLWICYS